MQVSAHHQREGAWQALQARQAGIASMARVCDPTGTGARAPHLSPTSESYDVGPTRHLPRTLMSASFLPRGPTATAIRVGSRDKTGRTGPDRTGQDKDRTGQAAQRSTAHTAQHSGCRSGARSLHDLTLPTNPQVTRRSRPLQHRVPTGSHIPTSPPSALATPPPTGHPPSRHPHPAFLPGLPCSATPHP